MWADSLTAWTLTPAHLVLLEEACRTADRLELLDGLIRARVEQMGAGAAQSGDGEDESPSISGLLAEARAQQTTLKGLLLELRQGQRAGDAQAAGAKASDGTATGRSGVADLTARIAARRGEAKG